MLARLAGRSILRHQRHVLLGSTSSASAVAASAIFARRTLATPTGAPPPPPNGGNSKPKNFGPTAGAGATARPNAPPQTPTQPPTSERTPNPPPNPPKSSANDATSAAPGSATAKEGEQAPTPPPPSSSSSSSSSSAPIESTPLPSLDITSSSDVPTPAQPEGSDRPPAGRTGAKAASTQTSIDRQRRYLARLWAGLFLAGCLGGVVYMGREWTPTERELGLDQGVEDTFLARIKRRGREAMDYFNKPQWKELLPPPLPFPHGRPYTLVIDIDDLLVTSTWDRQHGWRTAKRPGVDYFLAYMSQFYEIVIFTTQYVYSAQPIIESLDPFTAFVQYRLFRESARMHNGHLVKDLSYLNRDLSKVIMIDTVPEHAALQPENAIILPKWDGKPGDKGLVGLIPFLESIAIHKVPDVRPILQKYAGKDIATEYARVEAEQKRLAIEEWNRTHPQGHSPGLGGFTLSSIFGGAPSVPPPPKMPMSYLEQKRAEAQQIYAEEQKYFREHGEEMRRMIEEDKQRQLREMKGSLFGYLGLGGGQGANPQGGEHAGQQPGAPGQQGQQGPGAMSAPVGPGTSTGQTPPVVGAAVGAAGKTA